MYILFILCLLLNTLYIILSLNNHILILFIIIVDNNNISMMKYDLGNSI